MNATLIVLGRASCFVDEVAQRRLTSAGAMRAAFSHRQPLMNARDVAAENLRSIDAQLGALLAALNVGEEGNDG